MTITSESLTLNHLKTELIWRYFLEITQIPRPSFHEQKIKAYLLNWANQQGFDHEVDAADNIVIFVPASEGYETHNPVVLQAHKDMVCEKNADVDFDFLTQGLDVSIEDGWLKANGTTLGADNGLGIAAAMAVATDSSVDHPPLEILVTATEERGLIGANNLSDKLLSGKTMINLDTESWGDIYIGCAGSRSAKITLPFTRVTNTKSTTVSIKIHGLKGGHSGLDIHQPRINSAKFLGLMLNELNQKFDFLINDINAGNLPNAIPREAHILLSIDKENESKLMAEINDYYQRWFKEYQRFEPHFKVDVNIAKTSDSALDKNTQNTLITFINAIHSGVLSMSPSMPNLVETSNNLSSIKHKDNQLIITIYTRSDNALGIDNFLAGIKNLADNHDDAGIEISPLSPGWKPDIHSKILTIAEESHEKLYGKKANIKAIHAGLECGAIAAKYPGMDMVSIGPTIENAHSPDEAAKIDTVAPFYRLLCHMLAKL
ncbi:MAG: aminoacyl-histidine dipeptidase [Francisellaceae bacterium]